MPVFTLQQDTLAINGAYQVTNTVTNAVDADVYVFVFNATTGAFSHYASVADVVEWPITKELAQVMGLPYFRASKLVRTWTEFDDAQDDVIDTANRVQSLADELTAFQGLVNTTNVVTITGS